MKLKQAPEFMAHAESTVDIEVENTHSYQLDNGVVVHNTTGKVMGVTEGGHLPPVDYYIRWVQMPKDGPEHREHMERGYPIKDVSHKYHGYVVVGFPTKHPIVDLMGEHVVTTSMTTIYQQFEFLRLVEKHWLGGSRRNNQLSVTLKYDPRKVDYHEFMKLILDNQSTVRCCAIMPIIPSEDIEAIYGYQPEESITRERYLELTSGISRYRHELYDEDRLSCEGGICPIEPTQNTLKAA
jgi:hypothetical protein